MILLSGHESLQRLKKIVKNDPSIRLHECEDGDCIFIQPMANDYDLGLAFIKQIYIWLCHGEYPHLRVVNVFPRYDCNTLKICVNDNESYRELIDCIEDHDLKGLKPYEHD